MNQAEDATETQVSDNQSDAPSFIARSKTQDALKKTNDDLDSQFTKAKDGTESIPGSPLFKAKT